MEPRPPDVVLLAPQWPTRALLRAQLAEEGYEVVATDAWPIPRRYFRPPRTPRLVVVDLHGLPDPRRVLDDLRALTAPDAVLVITALGSLPVDDVRQRGFHAMARPASVGDVVARVHTLLGPASPRSQS